MLSTSLFVFPRVTHSLYSNREVGRDTTQPHEFKWRPLRMPMVSVFPAATNLYFPYGSLNDKWKSVPALRSLLASPLEGKLVKSQGKPYSSAQHTKDTKHKPNSFHDASALANLDSLPQRAASILNGNDYTHWLAYIHTSSHEQMKCKRQRGEREEFKGRQRG